MKPSHELQCITVNVFVLLFQKRHALRILSEFFSPNPMYLEGNYIFGLNGLCSLHYTDILSKVHSMHSSCRRFYIRNMKLLCTEVHMTCVHLHSAIRSSCAGCFIFVLLARQGNIRVHVFFIRKSLFCLCLNFLNFSRN